MGGRCKDCLADQVLSEAGRQWKNPDAFDGERAGMRGIEFAMATRIAKVLPVGIAIACSTEAGLFDEGFEEHRAIAVAGEPVVGQAAVRQAEELGGQVSGAYPREDEETGIIDDEMEAGLALGRRPTNELVAWRGFPGSGPEAWPRAHRLQSERARRVTPGSAASMRIRASSSSLKSRPQYIIVGLPASPIITSCPGPSPCSARERSQPTHPSARARAR